MLLTGHRRTTYLVGVPWLVVERLRVKSRCGIHSWDHPGIDGIGSTSFATDTNIGLSVKVQHPSSPSSFVLHLSLSMKHDPIYFSVIQMPFHTFNSAGDSV